VLGGATTLGLFVSLGLVFAAVHRAGVRAAEGASPLPSASSETAVDLPAQATDAPSSSTPPCTFDGGLRTLAVKALPSAGVVAASPGGHLAVGVATGPRTGTVFSLEASTLRVERALQGKATEPIRRVIPLALGNGIAVGLDTERRADALQNRHTILTEGAFDVGTNAGALAVSARNERVIYPLWNVEGSVDGLAAAPWGRPSGEDGVAIVLRRSGELLVGTLQPPPAAAAIGQLVSLGARASSGTPAVAAADGRALVAWVERSEGRPMLQFAHWGKSAAPSRPVALAAAGDVVGSPSVASLGKGRFLVVWSEMQSGTARVRVAMLGAEGTLVGTPLGTPALEHAPVAVDVAALADGHGLVTYLAPTPGQKTAELVGISLLCGD
jgi:hypothetical protein